LDLNVVPPFASSSLFLGFLVSVEVFALVRIPFTDRVLWRRGARETG